MAALDSETKAIVVGELKLMTLLQARESRLREQIAELRDEQKSLSKLMKGKRATVVSMGGEELLARWDEENAPQTPAGGEPPGDGDQDEHAARQEHQQHHG